MQQLMRFSIVSVCVAVLALFAGCATEEAIPFGKPNEVVGGVGSGTGSTSSSSGAACMVNPACTVSYATDVFPILDVTAKCSATGACHGSGQGSITLTANDPKALRNELLALQLQDIEPYIVPCNAPGSRMLCNMRMEILDPDAGAVNPFGKCGVLMPKVDPDDAVDDARLSLDQLTKIEEWIKCGAPDN